MKPLAAVLLLLMAVPCFAADLTGNWVVRDPLPDGTFRTTYLDLHQEGSRITGSIRVTQFYFKIIESTDGPDGFTLTASVTDGTNERRVKYEGQLMDDELHLATRRRPDAELIHMAKRLRWGGTVGTSLQGAWMTPRCAEWPMPWPVMG